jgi:hypothetical protein
MAFESAAAGIAFLVARLAFGLVVAFMGVNHFTNTGQMVPYAKAKGVPAGGLAVPFSIFRGGASGLKSCGTEGPADHPNGPAAREERARASDWPAAGVGGGPDRRAAGNPAR